ncbi:PDZ and LIM domain protein Zasp isoform X5 [Pararge aegeria]|uniref:PDZ and LIM domain protein Zasp isoform X5 n=1 Tax=Pararge aegeria TaxID=116150 RepID=UPI0019D0BA07|nr:PDZ and LIM domain protein Zasp isoform X5 [Pararge aegeria]
MAQLITVRLNKSDQQPLGFRLQGGKDFGTPLVVQKVNGGGAAERAGLQAGDALIRVNTTDVYTLRHQEAQDTIRAAGPALELTVQRGGGTWRPAVTPTGSLPRPGSKPLGSSPVNVTNTSLKATPQPTRAFGSGHNNVAKPFGYMNGSDNVKSIVNKQYNTPVNMYSDKTIAETLSAQTEVLAGGVLGVNFKKNEKTYDSEKSAVFKVLQEAENDPEPVLGSAEPSHFLSRERVVRPGAACVRACVPAAPARLSPGAPHRPSIPVGSHRVLADGRVTLGAPAPAPPPLAIPPLADTPYCCQCNRYIDGVFVRIKDKNLHVECFKCATCGSSLKNQGYYNLNGKLYCDIHAKLVARQNPPAANLEPVTVSPGGRIPTNTYSTPLPPLSTNNYTNGSSSMFSPSSNLSGPKPFGSSIGSAYSPASLSPRSAPMSPARPLVAQAPAPAPAALSPAIPASTPFAPINETQSVSSPHKTEFKSPAEERLIRKMAKMALNGYEIGIQRKIKPADHIQSMADKIQDTVVTKHPLNSDSLPSGENSRESTLKRPLNKNFDKGFKSLDNSLLNTSSRNHHTGNDFVTIGNSHTPIPPPLPTTPVPTFQAHSTPITNILNNIPIKRHSPDLNLKSTNTINKNETQFYQSNNEKSNNGGYSSSEDSSKDKPEYTFNTLKKNGPENVTLFNENNISLQDVNKSELKSEINFSNTLSKRKLFERNDAMNESNFSENNFKMFDKINNSASEKNYASKNNSFENSIEDIKSSLYQEEHTKKLPNTLCDNTLYTYKSGKCNEIDGSNTNNKNENIITDHIENNYTGNSNYDIKKNTDEIVVRRREKKNIRNDDGRRDSHIIARPLSTMTSVDVADGQYPVCHVCDKAITRGPFITALGRIWCPEHFICVNATCRRQLQDIGFVEENGQLYCEYCFEQYIAPACDKCHAKIKGDCLNAIGKHFHPECFSCVYCGKLFGNNPFFLEDGLPYCEADWNELFTTKCFACGFPVEAGDRWVEALNNNYHSQCFNCTVCKKNLEGQSFFAKGGRPFCKIHAR